MLKIILLYNQIEYTAVKIILKVATKAAKWLFSNKPTSIKNSPTKLLVPGKLIFESININRQKLKIGIVETKPL